VLETPGRASAVRAGGERLSTSTARMEVLEVRPLPTSSPVVAIAEHPAGDLIAAATFDDGAFATEKTYRAHLVPGLAAVNGLAFDAVGTLYAATDDGAYRVQPAGVPERLARGGFSAVTRWRGAMWMASRAGVSRVGERGLTTWGAAQGLSPQAPVALAPCGETLCVGAVDGLWLFDGETAARRTSASGDLPTDFVTAVAGGPGAEVWAGTFDGGIARMGSGDRAASRLTPADGLMEGRIHPRALAVVGDVAYAGTPSGLLVIRGTEHAVLPVGGEEITAVAPSRWGGVWLGARGRALRVSVELAPALAARVHTGSNVDPEEAVP
jgi:ligand-binding sensor domain-containing protein